MSGPKSIVNAPFDLRGKAIGVTGGAGHLGRSIAMDLAEAGATVVICGRDESKLAAMCEESRSRSVAGRMLAKRADVGRQADVDAVLDILEAETGRVDGWVNNAFSGRTGRLLSLREEDVQHIVASGLTHVILATDVVARRMVAHGAGAIVNVASMYGIVSPNPVIYESSPQFRNPPAYGAAKAGVVQFTRYAACHLGPSGVRVNAVSPGPFPSPSVQEDRHFIAQLAERVPLGRIGMPHEVAHAVRFLLCEASSFVTGHNLVVDGGWTAW